MSKSYQPWLLPVFVFLVACGGDGAGPDREPPSVPSAVTPAAPDRDSKPSASSGTSVSFLLESDYLYTGGTPIVRFDSSLPANGGQYWITVVEASRPDEEYGDWQYVEAGQTEVRMSLVTRPGWYEVRLHDRYPELSSHVVSRAALEVVAAPPTERAAPSPAAREAADFRDDSPPVAAADLAAGDNPFDRVSFKSESEVLALVGPPAAKLVEEDRIRWYYLDQYLNQFGEMACPELHFMDGEVRAVVYYPPPVMADHIETARLLGGVRRSPASGSRARTFTYDEAYELAQGRSRAEIAEVFGEPTSKRVIEGREIWQYDDLVHAADGPYLFAIAFEGDRVLEVQAMR